SVEHHTWGPLCPPRLCPELSDDIARHGDPARRFAASRAIVSHFRRRKGLKEHGCDLHLSTRGGANSSHDKGMTLEEQFATFLAKGPTVDPTAYVAPGAIVIGDVRIGPRASVWPGCVLRGDINFIEIGEATNVQDGTIVHLAD